MSQKFHDLDESVIQTFMKVWDEQKTSYGIDFTFIGSTKSKELISIKRIPEQYSFLMEKDMLVIINEGLFDAYDEDSINILFEQEISRISVNLDSGKITINKPDVITSSYMVSKYGSERVFRANQVDILAATQNESLTHDYK